MAGYSGRPLPFKLGIVTGHRVLFLEAPKGFDETLGVLPQDVSVSRSLAERDEYDVVVFFVTAKKELVARFDEIVTRMTPACGFWVAWPKKASGVATDLTEDVIRDVARPTGLVDNTVCALDETWSGLRLVIRKELRAKRTPRR